LLYPGSKASYSCVDIGQHQAEILDPGGDEFIKRKRVYTEMQTEGTAIVLVGIALEKWDVKIFNAMFFIRHERSHTDYSTLRLYHELFSMRVYTMEIHYRAFCDCCGC
jgi:hypothetical protein